MQALADIDALKAAHAHTQQKLEEQLKEQAEDAIRAVSAAEELKWRALTLSDAELDAAVRHLEGISSDLPPVSADLAPTSAEAGAICCNLDETAAAAPREMQSREDEGALPLARSHLGRFRSD